MIEFLILDIDIIEDIGRIMYPININNIYRSGTITLVGVGTEPVILDRDEFTGRSYAGTGGHNNTPKIVFE